LRGLQFKKKYGKTGEKSNWGTRIRTQCIPPLLPLENEQNKGHCVAQRVAPVLSAEVQEVISRWDSLPDSLRQAVLVLVRSSGGK
jgi:hypothetical protein